MERLNLENFPQRVPVPKENTPIDDDGGIKFKINSIEKNIESIERRLGSANEATKRALEAQIAVKKEETNELRNSLEKLERKKGIGHA